MCCAPMIWKPLWRFFRNETIQKYQVVQADANFLLLALSLERGYYFCDRKPLSIESNSCRHNIFSWNLHSSWWIALDTLVRASSTIANSSPNVSCEMPSGKTWLCGADNLPLRSWCNDSPPPPWRRIFLLWVPTVPPLAHKIQLQNIHLDLVFHESCIQDHDSFVVQLAYLPSRPGGPFWTERLNAGSMPSSAVKVTSRQANLCRLIWTPQGVTTSWLTEFGKNAMSLCTLGASLRMRLEPLRQPPQRFHSSI